MNKIIKTLGIYIGLLLFSLGVQSKDNLHAEKEAETATIEALESAEAYCEPPAMPDMPNIEIDKDEVILTMGEAPKEETWYWQWNATGTSTSSFMRRETISVPLGYTVYLRSRNDDTRCWSDARVIDTTISIPDAPTVSIGCGQVTLVRNTPPNGETWYWQSTSLGTSTANSTTSVTLTNGTVYYLRAQNNSTGNWGTAIASYYQIIEEPDMPPAPTIEKKCDKTEVIMNVPEDLERHIEYYWQETATGISRSNDSNSRYTSDAEVMYLRALNEITECWSAARRIDVTVDTDPETPDVPTVTNNCGETILTRGTPPEGVTWYWQSSSSSRSTADSSESITLTSGTTYYLRAKNNTADCWSNLRSIAYTVDTVPQIPELPTVNTLCGEVVLTKGTAPGGETWYWQDSATGTSIANSSTSVTRSSGTAYYLRSRHNTSLCWGDARSISYSVTTATIPETPPLPTISISNFGRASFIMGDAPSGETWYWQETASGTSLESSDKEIHFYAGDMYLRAKNNASGCWSEARYFNTSQPRKPEDGFVVEESCGQVIITRTEEPDSDEIWYWQESPTGTSTENSSATVTVTSGDIYYLRAKNSSFDWWSDAESVRFTDVTIPELPMAPTIVKECGVTIITLNTPEDSDSNDDIEYYWQETATGTVTTYRKSEVEATIESPFYSTDSGSSLYLRARNDETECWGPALFVDFDIDIIPDAPQAPSITNNCGETILTRSTPPQGETWYWQSSASATSTANASVSIRLTEGTVHYLRSINNATGCWSDATAITYSVIPIPIWYADVDNDGFGDPDSIRTQCEQPEGYVANNDDRCPREYGELQGCIFKPYDIPELSTDQNYVFTRVYQEQMTSSDSLKYNKDVMETVTYYDGVGRELQKNTIRAGGNYEDLILPIVYDQYGRMSEEYEAYGERNNNGAFEWDAADHSREYFYDSHDDVDRYTIHTYHNSPLGRKKSTKLAMDRSLVTDHNHQGVVDYEYGYNVESDDVLRYEVSYQDSDVLDADISLLVYANDGYAPTALAKTVIKDENWEPSMGKGHTREEYTNQKGQVVLKRAYTRSQKHDTYYVYDGHQNLVLVIPPLASEKVLLTSDNLDQLCYQYRYDQKGRVIKKKIPGKGWEQIVYDHLDRPVLTQDAVMARDQQWLFTRYDVFGRVAYTGILTNNIARPTLQNQVDAYTDQLWVNRSAENTIGGVTMFYDDQGWPELDTAEVLTIQYYDDYEVGTLVEELNVFQPATVYDTAISMNVKGLPTINLTKVLDTDQWIYAGTAYDAKGRAIRSSSKNTYLQHTEVVNMRLDFAGKVLESKTTHTKGTAPSITTTDFFTYDRMGRVRTHHQQIGDDIENVELIAGNAYNGLGQLESKKLGNRIETPLQKVDYRYNERGWLSGINNHSQRQEEDFKDVHTISLGGDDLWGMQINYSHPTADATPLYNGNISQIHWKTTSEDASQKTYNYTYDGLNRITNAISSNGNYTVSNIVYDVMGNILSLKRQGHMNTAATSFGAMDFLSYEYDDYSNQLLSVKDLGSAYYGFRDRNTEGIDYTYDINGNMIEDKNKGITGITYNHLNLPTSVAINNSDQTGTISYIYDATGAKLQKNVSEGSSLTTTDYAGSYVYKNGALEFFHHAEGYVEPEGDAYQYVYQYKDHLGNIRLSFSDDDGDYEQIIASSFHDRYDQEGWQPVGGTATVHGLPGVLVARIQYSGDGVEHRLNDEVFSAGEEIKVYCDIDVSNTRANVRVTLQELTAEGVLLRSTFLDEDVQTGNHQFRYTVQEGTRLALKIDTDGTYLNQVTSFLVNEVGVTRGTLEIREEKNYYPFGLQHKGYNSTIRGRKHAFGFTGKEEQDEIGLNWIDITARNYDPALGRWMNIDPLAEVMRRHSPYNYAFDNPIFFMDPDGMMPQGCCGGTIPSLDEIRQTVLKFGKGFVNGLTSGTTLDTFRHAESVDEGKKSNDKVQEAGRVVGVVVQEVVAAAATGGASLERKAISETVEFGAKKIAKEVAQEGGEAVAKRAGSGPVAGVLEVSENVKSVAQFKNFNPKNAVEFVFDPKSETFVVGKMKEAAQGLSPHQNLAKSIGADNSVVGGMFKRGSDGQVLTNEASGHFHQNWTPEIRKQFSNFLESYTNQTVNHTSGPAF